MIGETGPHLVYLSLPFLGYVRNVRVSAKKILNYPWVTFDTYSIDLEGDSVVSSSFLSHASDHIAWEVDVLGTQGVIRMDLHSMLLSVQRKRDLKRRSLALSSLRTSRSIATGVVSNALGNVMGRSFLGHDLIVSKFVKSVTNGTPVPVPPEEGQETTRLMELICSMCPIKVERDVVSSHIGLVDRGRARGYTHVRGEWCRTRHRFHVSVMNIRLCSLRGYGYGRYRQST